MKKYRLLKIKFNKLIKIFIKHRKVGFLIFIYLFFFFDTLK